MKRFMETKFILALKDTSLSVESANLLEKDYGEFVTFLFSEGSVSINKTNYRDSLLYTRSELACLTEVSGKKCHCLSY